MTQQLATLTRMSRRGARVPTRVALTAVGLAVAAAPACARNGVTSTGASSAGVASAAVAAIAADVVGTVTPWRVSRSIADSLRTEVLAPGVQLHHLVNIAAPWRAEVLDVDLEACVAVRSVKGGSTAVGRTTTSALLSALPDTVAALAAVNADFFLAGGVPVGALVESGRLLAGPGDRPVFAMSRAGRPWIGNMTADGRLMTTKGRITLETWNRPSAKVPGVVDASWGTPLDSLARRGAWTLVPTMRDSTGARYVAVRAEGALPLMARGDTLLIVGLGANAETAAMLSNGDTVRVRRALRPFQPREVVGGFPLLVRDSVIATVVDSAGAVSFRGLNPRTAVGYAAEGRRLLFAVIDGRQPGYSIGMTVRQTAELMLALGACGALNLDGGGSSAMVTRAVGQKPRVVNHPSDSAGERAVGDAIALLRSCRVPQ